MIQKSGNRFSEKIMHQEAVPAATLFSVGNDDGSRPGRHPEALTPGLDPGEPRRTAGHLTMTGALPTYVAE